MEKKLFLKAVKGVSMTRIKIKPSFFLFITLRGFMNSFHANVPFLNPQKTFSGVQKCQTQPQELFCKKGVLKIFANFTGKHLCWCHVKSVKFLSAPILNKICERLLLKMKLCDEKMIILNLIYNLKFRIFQTVRETHIRTLCSFNYF